MKVSELVNKAYLIATGKNTPVSITDKNGSKLLQLANIYQELWASEPNTSWNSLYEDVEIGTISNTDTYDLDSSIRRISNRSGDSIKVVKDNTTNLFPLVSPDELTGSGDNVCAQIGSSLKFNRTFTADDQLFGGIIVVPAYTNVPVLSKENDTVAVDDPNWLVFSIAAKWSMDDSLLVQNYPNLLQIANNAMAAMKKANQPQISSAYRTRATPNMRLR